MTLIEPPADLPFCPYEIHYWTHSTVCKLLLWLSNRCTQAIHTNGDGLSSDARGNPLP